MFTETRMRQCLDNSEERKLIGQMTDVLCRHLNRFFEQEMVGILTEEVTAVLLGSTPNGNMALQRLVDCISANGMQIAQAAHSLYSEIHGTTRLSDKASVRFVARIFPIMLRRALSEE